MSIAMTRKLPAMPPPLLVNGDRMRQPEFHRRYLACPDDTKFELVGGIVYMASPLRLRHSSYDEELGFPFSLYRRATPGVEVLRGATAILGDESGPQPDLGLRILPEYRGQSQDSEDEYVLGPPELLAEIACSSRSIDLHQKRRDYRRAGVVEYVVLCVEEPELHWFDFRNRRNLRPNADGIYCSRVFPGLWIAGQALLERDSARVEQVLRQGMASEEHADFVVKLQSRLK